MWDLVCFPLLLFVSLPIPLAVADSRLIKNARSNSFWNSPVFIWVYAGQHSAFIIAGSLDNPTKSRWATCTKIALMFAGSLALCCGVGGFVGFQENTQGNILNSLDQGSLPANIARGLLGSTMLFVYPMVGLVGGRIQKQVLFW